MISLLKYLKKCAVGFLLLCGFSFTINAQFAGKTTVEEALKRGDLKASVYYIDSLASNFAIAMTASDSAEASSLKGQVSIRYGNVEGLLKHMEDAYHIALRAAPNIQQKFRNNYAIALEYSGRFSEALPLHQLNLEVYRKLGDSLGISKSLNNIAIVYRRESALVEAIAAQEESTLIDSLIESPYYSSGLANLIDLYSANNQFVEVTARGERALMLSKKIGDVRSEGSILFSLGGSHAGLGNYSLAEDYLMKALDFSEKTKDPRFKCGVYSALAELKWRSAELNSAIEMIDSALHFADGGTITALRISKAGYLLDIGTPEQIQESKIVIDSAFASATRDESEQLKLQVRALRIAAASATGAVANAASLADSFCLYAQGRNYPIDDDLAVILATAYRDAGRHGLAASYLDTAYSFLEQRRANDLKGASLLTQLEISRRDGQIDRLSLDVELAKERAQTRTVLLWCFSGIGILLCLVGYMQFARKKEREVQNRALKKANDELEQKNVLLKIAADDAFHRVRNDFQSATSYLGLLATQAASQGERIAVLNAERQLASFAEINALLYRQRSFNDQMLEVFIDEYFALQHKVLEGQNIELNVKGAVGENSRLPGQNYLWLGIVINECLTNAIKHSGETAGGVKRIDVQISHVYNPAESLLIKVGNSITEEGEANNMERADPAEGNVILDQLRDQLHWQLDRKKTTNQYLTTLYVPI